MVDFHKDARTVKEAYEKIARLKKQAASSGDLVNEGSFTPILMCEKGARKRGLDLTIAAADARYWWQTGLVPLRETPLNGHVDPREVKAGRQPTTRRNWIFIPVILLVAAASFMAGWFLAKQPASIDKLIAIPSPTSIATPTSAYTIGSTWTRPLDGAQMVFVPAGSFRMGSPANTGEINEFPQHTVSLDAFWMDKTDVTNAAYAKCVNAGICSPPKTTYAAGTGSHYGNAQYDNYPVVFVDWTQAKIYCKWVGARLPTEAEWEKAARGTDGRIYPWGSYSPDCSEANYSDCAGDLTEVTAHSYSSGPYGALDMAGNVWQWVNDWYDPLYYKTSAMNNPTGPDSGKYRVLRGGAWYYTDLYLRSAYRFWYDPANISNAIGFRCARSSF